jgi:hypothetical protein
VRAVAELSDGCKIRKHQAKERKHHDKQPFRHPERF